MAPKSGHCTECQTEVWKFIERPDTHARIPLWPRPTSRYAVVEMADGSLARGIAYCATCGPAPGGPAPEGITVSVWADQERVTTVPIAARSIIAYEPASRYAYQLSEGFGTFLKAWLHDECNLDILGSGTITRTMLEWDSDRSTTITPVEEIAATVTESDVGRPDD